MHHLFNIRYFLFYFIIKIYNLIILLIENFYEYYKNCIKRIKHLKIFNKLPKNLF